jgi:hypothetical protein
LLARALIDADQELMRGFGERVAEYTAEKAKPGTGLPTA